MPGIVRVIPHMLRVPHLLLKGGGMSGMVEVIPHMLRVLHLLEKRGWMPHPGKQKMKVPGSEGVSVKEFIDDISKLKRKYSYALL